MLPLMGFNLLPSVLLILLNVTDKVNTAIKGWWLKALIVSLLSIVIISLIINVPWHTQTSHFVIMGCLPLIIIHFTVVSFTAHRLINKVQSQNRLLNKLSQQDDLTALFNRRTWQQKTQVLLDNYGDNDGALTLMLIDIDQFKSINDDCGHAIGDDILVTVAQVIKESCSDECIIGRLGGDEFIVVSPNDLPAAKKLAKTINTRVNGIKSNVDNLMCSVSIGMATIETKPLNIRTWFEAADKSLYEAKNNGRDTSVGKILN
jgi:diguanylate cyclase